MNVNATEQEKRDAEQREREARIKRQQIEEVFGLTGGELSDVAWEPWAPNVDEKPYSGETSDRVVFWYWFDGVPEWCQSDFGCKGDWSPDGVHYRTVVRDCLFRAPPETVIDGGRVWKRAAVLGPSSGERECPWKQADAMPYDDEDGFAGEGPEARCDLCESTREDGHGFIYIGDGWCEVVYRCIDPKCEACDEYIWRDRTEERLCDACANDAERSEKERC